MGTPTSSSSSADEAQLRLLETCVGRLNDMVVITEAEPLRGVGPRILYVNEAFERQTGYTRAEIIGLTPRVLQGPNTSRAALDRIAIALHEWRAVREELINYTRDGREFWLELDITPIADATGHVTHWVAIERNITDRKLAEQALRESEERFLLLARASKDAIWDWNLQTGSLWWNAAYQTQFGEAPGDDALELSSWVARIHPDDRERVSGSLREAAATGSESWFEHYRFRRGDGSYARVDDRAYLIRDDAGQPTRMLGGMSDVTERLALEDRLRQAQRLEVIGRLTGGVAHDFNNLLTVILGNAELLVEELAHSPTHRMLAEMISKAAQRGADLTGRLLSFARRQPLNPTVVDVNRLIGSMDTLLQRTVGELVSLDIVRAAALWPVRVDPGQLESSLLNLAINARDAMPGGGTLRIETDQVEVTHGGTAPAPELTPGSYVVLRVIDTGQGIAPENMTHVFEPFFSTKEPGKGTGLGLAMVHGFLSQSGGAVSLTSTVGVGTTVSLYLPRAGGRAEEMAAKSTLAVRGEGGATILLVEDDALVRTYAHHQLSALGYTVLVAENGPAALAHLRGDRTIDLLFTDVVMPGGMSGRELAEQAALLRPQLRVLYTSGYTEDAILQQGHLGAGIQLLSKPYRRAELATKIRSVLTA